MTKTVRAVATVLGLALAPSAMAQVALDLKVGYGLPGMTCRPGGRAGGASCGGSCIALADSAARVAPAPAATTVPTVLIKSRRED